MMETLLVWFRRLRFGLPCIKIDVASEQGPRPENQDNFVVIRHQGGAAWACLLIDEELESRPCPEWPEHRVRVAVFDGMGGHQQGRQIAQAAAERLARLAPVKGADELYAQIRQLHVDLQKQFSIESGERSPGTAVVWAELDLLRQSCWLIHLGDSRAYLRRDGAWRRLTHDHTVTEFSWRDQGLPAEPRSERKSEPVAQALGYGSWGILPDGRGIKSARWVPGLRIDWPDDLSEDKRWHADIKSMDLGPGDLLLLATDGLWERDLDRAWQAAAEAAKARNLSEWLVAWALRRDLMDNVTVASVTIEAGRN